MIKIALCTSYLSDLSRLFETCLVWDRAVIVDRDIDVSTIQSLKSYVFYLQFLRAKNVAFKMYTFCILKSVQLKGLELTAIM